MPLQIAGPKAYHRPKGRKHELQPFAPTWIWSTTGGACVRCAEPVQAHEAVTNRPLLLCEVGRVMETGRQLKLRPTSTHAEAAQAQRLWTCLSLFLSGLHNTAEQLTPTARWERIWVRILEPWRRREASL